MTCSACRALLEEEGAKLFSNGRALRLDATFPGCACEAFPMSDLSPGRIDREETLLRIVVSPVHMHRKHKEEVTASCLTSAETSGLSLLRMAHASDEEVVNTATVLAGNARGHFGESAGVFGVLHIKAAILKDFVGEGETEGCFCLYDTAEPSRRSHCEVFQRIFEIPDSTKLARRRDFYNIVKEGFVAVQNFRSGLLAHLAPAN